MDLRFVFSPTYSAWNKLSVPYNTNAITVKPDSRLGTRAIAPLVNFSKKALIAIAVVICTIVTAIFSILILPFRLYKAYNLENEALQKDAGLMHKFQINSLRNEISDYIDRKESKGKFRVSTAHKDEIITHAVTSYARSHQVYGPVVVAWVDYLLEKANREGKKLVFMARDGIAPYKVAMDMMKTVKYKAKYPHMIGQNKIELAYFSRALVNNATSSDDNKVLFQRYAEQLGMKDGDKCILVDIGFTGSMIDKIRSLLPKVKISFDYLISHTDRADGFIYSSNDPRVISGSHKALHTVKSIPYMGAGSNFATHWLEDTHQGVGKSATHLVEINGVIYPNTRKPGKKEYIVEAGSHDWLVRKWSSKAVRRSPQTHSPEKIKKKEAIENLDDTLKQILDNKLLLLIKHI